ncbi:MAG: class I SAM-dependent methyltransferase [Acidimicrobiales bacterium]|nr:class I SAM-dependent methyltransferase [Acidimicrobiales bacterium]
MNDAPVYDRIGAGYAEQRRPEPRWVTQIANALGDAGSVLNVGAGTGNYEPTDRPTVAIEPSPVMLEQRINANPVVQGVAERLPFADGSFDVAMGTLTLHHWTDVVEGLREVRRVARRQIFMLFEPLQTLDYWLLQYFPVAAQSETELQAPTTDTIAGVLDVVRVEPMPVPAECSDGVAAAYWRRPERYLDPAVQRSMSLLALLDEDERARGSARLAGELESGRWRERFGHLLELTEFDAGYRLVIAQNS